MKTVYLNKPLSKKSWYDFDKGHEFELKRVYGNMTLIKDKLTGLEYWVLSEDVQLEPLGDVGEITLEKAVEVLKEAAELIGNSFSVLNESDPVRLPAVWKRINQALKRDV